LIGIQSDRSSPTITKKARLRRLAWTNFLLESIMTQSASVSTRSFYAGSGGHAVEVVQTRFVGFYRPESYSRPRATYRADAGRTTGTPQDRSSARAPGIASFLHQPRALFRPALRRFQLGGDPIRRTDTDGGVVLVRFFLGAQKCSRRTFQIDGLAREFYMNCAGGPIAKF
jgi:hypothetical protein